MEVYCHHCGVNRADDAIYCSQCGRQLITDVHYDAGAAGPDELIETAASIEVAHINEPLLSSSKVPAKKRGRSYWIWLTPTVLAVVTAASLTGYYIYETSINDRVIELQVQAKKEALAGKYDEALAKLDQATAARPGYLALRTDAAIITHVVELKKTIQIAVKQLEEKKLNEAELTLGKVVEELKGHLEPIYVSVKEQLEAQKLQLAVLTLGEELAELETVDELAAKLAKANDLQGKEAATVRQQIIAKIVSVSYEKAEKLLKKKDYKAALTVTGKALTFSKDDERLMKLEKQINEAKAQYEQNEQRRLELAMQSAAAEDLKNQTAAVKVVHIEMTLDEFGDLNIAGELTNAATRPIYSVSVEYTVLDKEGNKLGSGVADVTPEYVEPGETMRFNSTVYGVYVDNTSVVVDHATWFLD